MVQEIEDLVGSAAELKILKDFALTGDITADSTQFFRRLNILRSWGVNAFDFHKFINLLKQLMAYESIFELQKFHKIYF